jgi:hypothetical protein
MDKGHVGDNEKPMGGVHAFPKKLSQNPSRFGTHP